MVAGKFFSCSYNSIAKVLMLSASNSVCYLINHCTNWIRDCGGYSKVGVGHSLKWHFAVVFCDSAVPDSVATMVNNVTQFNWTMNVHVFLGSAAFKKLKQILTRPRFISAIRKVSNYHQTSALEAKHSLDNQFAPKKTFYPYHSLMARFVTLSWQFIIKALFRIHI